MEGLAVLEQARNAGLTVWVEGDDLQIEGKPTPKALAAVDCLRKHKAEVLDYLRQQTEPARTPTHNPLRECRNSFTPHLAHEFPWECDPDSCYCWRTFGYPHICQGIPCRWVWPNGVPEKSSQ